MAVAGQDVLAWPVNDGIRLHRVHYTARAVA
jgi:hypothetical protein